MPIRVSHCRARQQLVFLLEDVPRDREGVIINRRNGEPATQIAADRLASLTEAANLPGSPANASRLLDALARALRGGRASVALSRLWANVGLERQAAGRPLSARLHPPRGA